jgi:hypothetical protein
MKEKTELEKAEYRDIARDTHFLHCKESTGGYCGNVLAHTPYETRNNSIQECFKMTSLASEEQLISNQKRLLEEMVMGVVTEEFNTLKFGESAENVNNIDHVNNINKEDVKIIDKYKCGGTTNYVHEEGLICDRCELGAKGIGALEKLSKEYVKVFDKEEENIITEKVKHFGEDCESCTQGFIERGWKDGISKDSNCATNEDRAQSGIYNPKGLYGLLNHGKA